MTERQGEQNKISFGWVLADRTPVTVNISANRETITVSQPVRNASGEIVHRPVSGTGTREAVVFANQVIAHLENSKGASK